MPGEIDWTKFIPILGPIVGLAAIWFSWRYAIPRKKLSYVILSESPLLRHGGKAEPRLKVMFEEQPVTDPHIVQVRLINSGNREIVAADYHEPLMLQVVGGAEVLTADFIDSDPRDLVDNQDLSITEDRKRIELPSFLLNVGDKYTVKLVTNQPGQYKVKGRIVGVKSIGVGKDVPWAQIASLVLTGLLATAALIASLTATKSGEPMPGQSLSAILAGVAAVLSGITLKFSTRRFRR